MRRLLLRAAGWLAVRNARAHAALFVGPPLPPRAFRLDDGRHVREVSRWNADHTMHTISFVSFDGSPLPEVPAGLDDFYPQPGSIKSQAQSTC